MNNKGKNWGRKNDAAFVWTKKRLLAAELLAEGVSKLQVAEKIGVSRATLYNWLELPVFTDYIDTIIFDQGVANKKIRVAKMKSMLDKMEQVIEEKIKSLLRDPTPEFLKGIVNEYRELLKQIAIEKQEWVELSESKVNADMRITEVNIHEIRRKMDENPRLEQEFKEVADQIIERYTK